jgi:DNA (cytosine-5)-methyltransferase 1
MTTHLDLFSGVGGFALAAKWAGFQTVAFCEVAEYPRLVLAKNFPGVPIHKDIRELSGHEYKSVGLITGSYPCQPFSTAGKRDGARDDRYIWPEMRRIINEARPRWVVAENVVGHVTLGLDDVLSDLEADDYACAAVVVPACAVNAPHRRARVWIIANSNGVGLQGHVFASRLGDKENCRDFKRAAGHEFSRMDAKQWHERALKSGVCRVDDGVPARVDRIRALGNAIVPQLAYEILRGIHENC